jgi:hypothetical protein
MPQKNQNCTIFNMMKEAEEAEKDRTVCSLGVENGDIGYD